jgi:hypothetical protein
MADIKLTFAWSESRVKLLRECAYKYFLNYYESWEGWRKSAPQRSQQAYLLKQLTNKHMWPGSIVHEVIEHVIKTYKLNGTWTPLQDAQELGVNKLRSGWISSTKKEWKNTPKSVNLFEHYYGEGLVKEETDRCKQIVLKSIEGFYSSRMAQIIQNLKPEDWVALEDFQKFNMDDGSEVSVKIDCGFKHNDKVFLLDWKTGKVNSNVIDQLVTYAMYALKKGFAKKLSDIVIVPVYLMYLGELGETELTVNKQQLFGHASVIKNESIILREAHNNRDNEEYFKYTDNTKRCQYCNFKEICLGANR